MSLPTQLALAFIVQGVSSYLSVAVLRAVLATSGTRFVITAAISDAVKLTAYSTVAVMAVRGTWFGVIAAVLGGACGNTVAHLLRKDTP